MAGEGESGGTRPVQGRQLVASTHTHLTRVRRAGREASSPSFSIGGTYMLGFVLGMAVGAVVIMFMLLPYPSIGGIEVPVNLACQEDEVITFVGVDELGCVHIDAIGDLR